MTRVRITFEPFDEVADPNHEMGVTEATYIELQNVLADFGDNVEIERDDELS